MDLDLYIDKVNRRLVSGPQNAQLFVWPNLVQGDTVRLVLHGQVPNTAVNSYTPYVDDPISFVTIKAGLGPGPDAAPGNGTFRVRLSGNDPLTGQPYVETTGPLPYNIPQTPAAALLINNENPPLDFLTAINNLASVKRVDPQGINLDEQTPQATNFFYIRWVNPAIVATFEILENRLEPRCFIRNYIYAMPAGQLQMLKFIVAPYSFTDQFAFPAADDVTCGVVRNGSTAQDCIQEVLIPSDATGNFSLTFNGLTTSLMPCADFTGSTDSSSELQSALNALYTDSQTRFSVVFNAIGSYYVSFVGPFAKTDYAAFGVTMVGQKPIDTPAAVLPLNGPALELALHGLPSIKLVFELEITDSEGVNTPVQAVVTILNDMIDGQMALANDPDWTEPVDPTVVPYNPTGTSIVAPGAYVTPIGGGAGVSQGTDGKSFIIQHNLGTQNCVVDVRETSGTMHRLPDNTYVTTYLDANRIEVDFQVAPSAGQYYVIIAAVVPVEMTYGDIEITIDQVIGLRTILNELLAAGGVGAPISQNQLPAHIPWYNNDAKGNPDLTSPKFDVLPDALLPADVLKSPLAGSDLPPGTPYWTVGPPPGLVVLVPGSNPPQYITILEPGNPPTNPPTWVLPIDILPNPIDWPGLIIAVLAALQSGANLPNATPFDIPDLTTSFPDPFALSNHCPEDNTAATVPSSVLPALFNTVFSGNVSGGLPPPSTAGYAGNRFTVVGAATSSATIYREGQSFQDGDVIASNGYHWYKVDVQGAAAYPKEYNQELFSFYVSPDMMGTKGSRFALDFTLQAQFISPDLVRGQYLLTLEIGIPQANTGAGIGNNLASVNWYAQIVQEVIILSNANTYHHFNYAVLSDATTGAYTATKGLYTTTNLPATVPANPGFAVRATLTQFDVENTVPNPTGQVTLKMLKAIASVVKPTS